MVLVCGRGVKFFHPWEAPILQRHTVTYFWCNTPTGITEAAAVDLLRLNSPRSTKPTLFNLWKLWWAPQSLSNKAYSERVNFSVFVQAWNIQLCLDNLSRFIIYSYGKSVPSSTDFNLYAWEGYTNDIKQDLAENKCLFSPGAML